MKVTFHGIDASNEISLLEYGLLVSNEAHEDGSGSHFCVYRQGDGFGTGHIYESDINNLLSGNDWANEDDLNSFYSFIGTTKEKYLTDSLCNKIHDLVSYFGSENIFGTDYYPMSKEEAIERYLSVTS